MTFLHYTEAGDPRLTERFLPGIPAADFETDEADVIAACLASGMYQEVKAPVRARTRDSRDGLAGTPEEVTAAPMAPTPEMQAAQGVTNA